MKHEIYVWDEVQQKVVLREERLPQPRVHVISDTMPLLKHMGTGKYTDSKSLFRRMTRHSGAIEAGNEKAALVAPPKEMPPLKEYERSVGEAYRQVKYKN